MLVHLIREMRRLDYTDDMIRGFFNKVFDYLCSTVEPACGSGLIVVQKKEIPTFLLLQQPNVTIVDERRMTLESTAMQARNETARKRRLDDISADDTVQ